MYIDYIDTPLGTMEFRASAQGVTQAIFSGTRENRIKTSTITDACKQQLIEYFNGQRKTFNLPLDPQGTTFQKSVWACLAQIPFGKTLSYGDIADMINN